MAKVRVEDYVGPGPVEQELPSYGVAVRKGERRKLLGPFDLIQRHGRSLRHTAGSRIVEIGRKLVAEHKAGASTRCARNNKAREGGVPAQNPTKTALRPCAISASRSARCTTRRKLDDVSRGTIQEATRRETRRRK